MKKVLIIAVALFVAISGHAQKKGDMYLSGTFEISGGNTNSSSTVSGQTTSTVRPSTLNFGIAPQFGYFFADNIEVNLALGYDLTKTFNSMDANDNKLFTREGIFFIRPGVSYYIKLTDKLYYTPAFSLGIGFGSETEDVSVNTTRKSGLTRVDISLSLLSFEFQPCEHLGIVFSAGDFGYQFTNTKQTNANGNTSTTTSTKRNNVAFGINLSTAIGFKYYF